MHMPLSLIANVRAACNAQTETVRLGSLSDLIGMVSRTREGGNAPAGLVRRTHAFDKTSGRPTTGATYKHVLHAKLEACTLTASACCSLPISTRHCARAVKGMDLKSIGLCPQGFESPRCRDKAWCGTFRNCLFSLVGRAPAQ